MKNQKEKILSVRLPEYYFQALDHSREKLNAPTISEVVRILIGFYVLPELKELEINSYEHIDNMGETEEEIYNYINTHSSEESKKNIENITASFDYYFKQYDSYIQYLIDTREKAKEAIKFSDEQSKRIISVFKGVNSLTRKVKRELAKIEKIKKGNGKGDE